MSEYAQLCKRLEELDKWLRDANRLFKRAPIGDESARRIADAYPLVQKERERIRLAVVRNRPNDFDRG